jgi:hypothetical protein
VVNIGEEDRGGTFWVTISHIGLFFFFFLVLSLNFELKTYNLSHSTSLYFVKVFFFACFLFLR